MQNVAGRLSVAWWFLYRSTQGPCVNSKPRIPSLDFSEPRSCDDAIDTKYSKKIFKPARAESGGVETQVGGSQQPKPLTLGLHFFKWIRYQVRVWLL